MSDFDLGYKDPLWARLEEKDAEIERLKDKIRGLEKLNQMTDEEVVMELKAEIERLKALLTDRMYELEEINQLRTLLSRAADALNKYGLSDDQKDLIAELRDPDIKTQLTQAHQDYEAFISDSSHRGFNAEAYWMGARGLFNPWLAQIQAEYAARKAKAE